MMTTAYCSARIGELLDTPDGVRVEFKDHAIDTFEELLNFFHSTYDRFATLVADRNAEGKYHANLNLSKIGGFGIQLQNRFGSSLEVGAGRDWWILISASPDMPGVAAKTPYTDKTLDFYLDGWHRTEFDAGSLLPKAKCIELIREWLDTNSLPEVA